MSDRNDASASDGANNNEEDTAPGPDRSDRAPGRAADNDSEEINSLSTKDAQPIIRGAKRIEDLQLKQLQLQFDLKAVRDELEASGKLRDLNHDDTSSDEDIEAAGGPSRPTGTRRGSASRGSTSRVTRFETRNDATTEVPERNSEVARLQELNETLQQKLRQVEEEHESDLATLRETFEEENRKLKEEQAKLTEENAFFSSELLSLRIQLGSAHATIEELRRSVRDQEEEEEPEQRRPSTEYYEELQRLKAIQETYLAENKKLKRQLHRAKRRRRSGDVFPDTPENLQSKLREAKIQRTNAMDLLNEQVAINDRISGQLKKAEADIEDLETENKSMDSFLRTKVEELGKLYNDLQVSESKRKELLEIRGRGEAENLRLSLDVDNLERDLSLEKQARAELKENHKELENRVQQQQTEYNELLKRFQDTETALKEAREEVVKKSSGNAKLRSQLAERQKVCDDLANRLEVAGREYSDAQRDIDTVRRILQEKEFDLSRLQYQMEDLETKNRKIKTELDQKQREMAALDQTLSSEISECNTQIESLTRKLQDEKSSHETLINEFHQLKSVELVDLRRRSKEELDKLRTQNSMREADLKSQIARLENTLLDAQAEKLDIQSERDNALVRDRKNQTQITQLEGALSTLTEQCNDARKLLREAERDASEMRVKFENSKRKEEALAEKQQQLEQTVSKQAIQIQELSRDDIETLKRQAEESKSLSQELFALRTEYSEKTSQWMMEQSSLSHQIQNQTEYCFKLEQELASYQGPENDRMSNYKSNVHMVYQIEVDRMNKDYASSLEFIKKSMESAEKERNLAKQKWLEMEEQVHDLKLKLGQSTRAQADMEKSLKDREAEVQKLEGERKRAEDQHAELHASYERVEQELREAQTVAQDMQNLASVKQRELDEIKDKYEDAQLSLITVRNSYDHLQNQLMEWEQMRKISLDRIYTIIQSDNYQVKALKFMKRFFTGFFPRSDLGLPYNTLRPPRRGGSSIHTFRGAALSVLAIVKFKRALQEGIKRKAAESEQYLKESGWTH